ncbi:bile acid:sodium symporter [uncultured Brevibacterium sp.]|uniref:arsenic resistance protein n=1 Tax=uncultured Brevibacterium sp. TaxID=189678 RepID=UPI00260051F0|nr:bile acid:sodium symporter [uncultured Brevibacterium sp.]
MERIVEWWDCHQVTLYLVAIAVGAGIGLGLPAQAPALAHAIEPALFLLLFATFVGIPLITVGRALRDVRFLLTVLVANFLVVPIIAFALSRVVTDDPGLEAGVLLVLLTPCIDYVIVFTGLAGGARDRLLAAAPLLMLVQMLLLPAYLLAFTGGTAASAIDLAPFGRAFLVLIVLPLGAAAAVQALARRHRAARVATDASGALMVPLMMVTLVVVIGSQIAAVGGQITAVLRVVPLYAVFLVLAVGVGLVAARSARLDVPGARAVVFSTATRNSLVVLPLALAMPAELALAPLAVVAQTLVELLGMVLLVRLVPVLVPHRPGGIRATGPH